MADSTSLQACPPRYDVRANRTVPLAVFLGGKDTVVDPIFSIQLLPSHSYVFFEPEYSHLDFKWAAGVASRGRAFESLLAFLHRAVPEAASRTRAADMQRLFGENCPELLQNAPDLRQLLQHQVNDPTAASKCTAAASKNIVLSSLQFVGRLPRSIFKSSGAHAQDEEHVDERRGCAAGFIRDLAMEAGIPLQN